MKHQIHGTINFSPPSCQGNRAQSLGSMLCRSLMLIKTVAKIRCFKCNVVVLSSNPRPKFKI